MRYKKDDVSALDRICFATARLILAMDYHEINNTDIINEADVSRSTFYVYFKNKEQVLIYICDHILDHIFSKNLYKENTKYTDSDLKDIIIRSFKHFAEEGELVLPVLDSGASSIFMKRLTNRLNPLITSLINQNIIGDNKIPFDIKLHQYTNGYVSLLQYYLRHAKDINPESIADYFFTLYK